jgi:hypothetical protein
MDKVKIHLKNIDADPNEIQDKVLALKPSFQFRIRDTYTFIILLGQYHEVESIKDYFANKGKTVLITREDPIIKGKL